MNNIILLGNPNVGKTTLYNTLTKSNEKASNWHGVTVDAKKKSFKINDKEFEVTDLPGLYSVDGYSNEEKIASNFLEKNKDDLIVNICDANNLKRNLELTKQLIDDSYKVVLAVNMVNDFKEFDEQKLSSLLGIPVVGIDARKSKSVEKLKETIYDIYLGKNSKFGKKISKINENIEKIDKFIEALNNSELHKFSKTIDKILLNKVLFLPFFCMLIFLVFYLTFGGFGEWLSGRFTQLVSYAFDFISNFITKLNISEIIKQFMISGVLNSLLTVFSFLPQILLLMLLFNVIEDSGLMSRFAFMFDGFMKKIGLTGKSLFSLMMGYGCTTSAVLTTRNLETQSLRKRTVLILPFSTCSAKLPVFLIISSLFFESYKYLFVLGLYILSILISILCACIYKKKIPDKDQIFILEMPKYRIPYLKKVVKDAISIALEFVYKIGTTVLIFGIVFWLLQNFSYKFEYLNGENYQNSILFIVSNSLSFIFKPIGLDSAGIVSVLLFGLIAKELIVVGLTFVNGVTGAEMLRESLLSSNSVCYFTPISSVVFLAFILLYSPCISALSSIKNEFGSKTALFVFVIQFVISYLVCFVLYNSIKSYNFIIATLVFVLVAIMCYFMVKLLKKKHCGGNCNACKKF